MDGMEVPELVASEDYDSEKCKLEASVRWLLARAYENEQVPPPYRNPFTENSQGEFQLSVSMVGGLTSSEIYCKACSNIFHDNTMHGYPSVLQTLAKRSIYVVDVHESAVTESLLQQDKPIKISAHLALIDSLLKAYTEEVATVQRVVQAVRKFTTFSASSELPDSAEEALVFWLNKVGAVVRQKLQKENEGAQENQHQRRVPVKSRPSDIATVPVLQDVCEDLNDGCILAVLISFYCPDAIKLHDIALKEAVGIADSLYNLQLLIEFCHQRPPRNPLHLSLNDLFYTRRPLYLNLIAFVAELFVLLEVKPIDCVRDVSARTATVTQEDNRPMTAQALKSAGRGTPAISQATKRSFQQTELTHTNSSPDLNSPGQGVPGPRIPLLPKRLQHRHGSLTDMSAIADDEEVAQAWADTPDGRRIAPVQGESDGVLLANVSMDSEMSLDVSADSNFDLDPTPRPQPRPSSMNRGQRSTRAAAITDPEHPDYMEVESVGNESMWDNHSARSSRNAHANGNGDGVQSPSERLMPAQLRPSKEKSNNRHTKEVESGEKYEKASPGTPNRTPQRTVPGKGYTTQNMGGSSGDSTPSEDYKTPSVESVPPLGSQISQRSHHSQLSEPAEGEPEPSAFDSYHQSFPRGPHSQPSRKSPPLPIGQSTPRASSVVGRSSAFERGKPAMQSFTLHDRTHTPQSARAAGIPVIDGSASSPRSSSDGSDQELRKLHSDHKNKESRDGGVRGSFFLNNAEPDGHGLPLSTSSSVEPPQRPHSLHVPKPIKVEQNTQSMRGKVKQSPVTSFAAIRNQRENGEVAAAFATGGVGEGGNLRSQFQNRAKSAGLEEKVAKRTTFGTMPNTTTWQENAKKAATTRPDNGQEEEEETVQPLTSELANIRMKLVESRRKIEDGKKHLEKQLSEQRQMMGKTAFMKVIKKKDDKAPDSNKENESKPDPASLESSGTVKSPVAARRIRSEDEADTRDASPSPIKSQRNRSDDHEPSIAPQASVAASQKSRSIALDKDEPLRRSPEKSRVHEQRHTSVSPVRHRTPKSESVRNRPVSAYDINYDRSPSPEDFAETGRMPTNQTPKQLSRKEIQETIDNVRQNWFSSPVAIPGDITFQKAPPMQTSVEELESLARLQDYCAKQEQIQEPEEFEPEIETAPMRQDSPPPAIVPIPKKPLNTSVEHVKSAEGYSSSLEKLNTSLSDLQGEIMRLSLQQDAIKKRPLVETSTNAPVSLVGSTSGNSQYYSQEPIATGINQPSAFTQRPPQHQYPSTAHPQPTYPYPPPPPPPGPYGHQYPGPQYYPGAPQYQPGMYHQQQGLGYPYPNPNQQWQQHPPPPHQNPYQPPVSTYTPPYTATTSAISSSLMDPPLSQHNIQAVPTSPANSSGSGLPTSSPQAVASQHPPSPMNQTQNQNQNQDQNLAPLRERTLSPEKPFIGEGDEASTTEQNTQEDEGPQVPEGESEGFFIAFEEPTAVKRPKPQLGKNRLAGKKKDKKSPTTPTRTPAFTKGPESASPIPDEILHPKPPPVLEPGVGFVIGAEEAPPTELTEMELKKKKMMEAMMKRQQKKNQDREKLEKKRQKQREKEQMKKEQAEAKKAEEAAKRERVFQEYLKKKEQQEQEEEESRAGISPAKRREKKPTKPRPKSQPPQPHHSGGGGGGGGHGSHGALDDKFDKFSASSASSQEDVNSLRSGLGGMDQTDYSGNLAYGGATHRRPPSPDKTARGEPQDDYTYSGPKLFVKPSSKSNRHIINNAIAHCCLAGTEMSKSEANHFVILFRDAQQQYKGLYNYYPETGVITKIHGVGPKSITDKMLDRFYKYNSGSKNFSQIATTKHMSATIDAVTLQSSVWKKPVAKKPAHGMY